MLRRQFVAAAVAAAIILAGHAQAAQQDARGYELYSWKHKAHWHYSLFRSDARPTSLEEITSTKVSRKGAAGLREQLRKLPRGEEVVWRSDAPAGVESRATKHDSTVRLPSRKRIKSVRSMCARLGLKLKLD